MADHDWLGIRRVSMSLSLYAGVERGFDARETGAALQSVGPRMRIQFREAAFGFGEIGSEYHLMIDDYGVADLEGIMRMINTREGWDQESLIDRVEMEILMGPARMHE
eukprot:8557326-Pyramimonas_sp.AAC.2